MYQVHRIVKEGRQTFWTKRGHYMPAMPYWSFRASYIYGVKFEHAWLSSAFKRFR